MAIGIIAACILAGLLALAVYVTRARLRAIRAQEQRDRAIAQQQRQTVAQIRDVELHGRKAEADAKIMQAQALILQAQAKTVQAQAEYEKIMNQRREVDATSAQTWYSIEQSRQFGLVYPREAGHYPVVVSEDANGQRLLTHASSSRQRDTDPTTPAQAPAVVGNLALPGVMRDIDVWRRWDFGPENIYLATGPGGRDFTCSDNGWHHIAHDASTGGGKTLLARAEIAVQLKLGMDVILANPHFTPIHHDKDHPDGFIDWRPIAALLERQGPIEVMPGLRAARLLITPAHIRDLLQRVAERELDRRFEARRHLRPQDALPWTSLYIAIDELPWLVVQYPEIAGYLATILQRGRAVDVRVSTNAQGFLVSQTGLNGSVRENFGTAYWLGGSTFSGAKLLDMKEADLKKMLTNQGITPGRGIALLRNEERVKEAQPARVPLGTNEGLYYLLGRADEYTMRSGRGTAGKPEGTAPTERDTGEFRTGPEALIVDADDAPPTNVRTLYPENRTAHPEPSDSTQKEYRLSDSEQQQLIGAYRMRKNLQESLRAIEKGNWYKPHAREVLIEAGLMQRKEEA